jgi:hypothetical protein
MPPILFLEKFKRMQKLIISNILGSAKQLPKKIYTLHRQAGSHSAGQSQLKIVWNLFDIKGERTT